MCGSSAKKSIRSASSTSDRFPMLTKAENPSRSSDAQSINAAPTVPLCETIAISPRRVISGHEAHTPWYG